MFGSESELEDAGGTVFRDVTLLALGGFIAIVLLLLPWLNPQGFEQETTTEPAGRVIVELFWPNDSASDVDLWVEAPGESPVGFSSMGSLHFNLLRDDLGRVRDATPINYEIAFSRGIAAGEHTVNVHLYRRAPGEGPIPARVVVSIVEPGQRARTPVIDRTVRLRREGEERTVVRFAIDRRGKLVRGSEHTLPRSLIEPGKRIAYRRAGGPR